MKRREFLRFAGLSALSGASVFSPGCSLPSSRNVSSSTSAFKQIADVAHFSLRIDPVNLELAPGQIIQTIGYNGSAPGPLLRIKEGQQVTMDVHNDSDVPELVHWHGLFVPSEVDGAMEEGTPMVPAGGSRQYSFVAQPKTQNRPRWHYINLPFKPEGQPASVQAREPEPVNILTAMAESESVVKNGNDPERKPIALAWLFHLVGDIHQPLHTAQLFTIDYPQGDRGGNEICVRVTQAGQTLDLHRFWDGVITSSQNLRRLRNEATALRNRQEFQRSQLTDLANADFESWAKESYKIATKIAYRNGGQIGSTRDGNIDCTMVAAAPVLPVGYLVSASRIADRRMILAGYRLAGLLTRVVSN